MSKTLQEYLRTLFKAIAVYAAGAWVAVEVVDFAVQQYGLSKFLVDAAVIVAFGGGMVTGVLVWFHGEPGSQRASVPEISAISAIVVATVSGLLYLSTGSPTKAFEELPGYRLVLEYRDIDHEEGNGHIFSMVPRKAIEWIGEDDGIFSLAPEGGHIRGPIIRAQFSDHPTMFTSLTGSDFVRVIFVLPYEPTDLRELITLGAEHDSVKIKSAGFSIEIDTSVIIAEQESGVTIRVTNRSTQATTQQ